MKGILLAGGRGTRLQGITQGQNKHLLPIQGEAMFLHGLRLLRRAGVSKLVVVVNPNEEPLFQRELENCGFGDQEIRLIPQNRPSGIPDGLLLALGEEAPEPCALLLGDNFFEEDLAPFIRAWNPESHPAQVFLKRVEDCSPFGTATLDRGQITSLIEKPPKEAPGFAVTGCYLLDSTAHDKAAILMPSKRGETEILELLSQYQAQEGLSHQTLRGWWADAGTPIGLNFVQKHFRSTLG
ncbi:MAG: sugar phosphate nucleotidyltransferase [Planctomycetota bacterium]|jgi:glucose-1-phosphate thymidylyltransferase|nr:sugar phosphate nucleotidyltransferase [Planctomycetota bacterium]